MMKIVVMMVMMLVFLLGSRLGDLLGKGTIRLLGGKGLAPFWGGTYLQENWNLFRNKGFWFKPLRYSCGNKAQLEVSDW